MAAKLPTPTVKGLAMKVFPLQMKIRDEGMFKYLIKPDDMNFIAESKYIELYFILQIKCYMGEKGRY
jgi:hypothetical protein